MAKEIRVTEHYSASIANNIAEGARVLGALRDVGLNLIAFWSYKHGGGLVAPLLLRAAKQTKLRLGKAWRY
jgi:hypothetical protein